MVAFLAAALAALQLGMAQPAEPNGEKIRRGMTMAEVKRVLGAPQPSNVSRQVLFRRHIEQWRYEKPSICVEFNCVRGEEPFVMHVYRLDKRR